MRFLLTLMAMAMLAVSVGCDKPADDAAKKATDSASTAKKTMAAPADAVAAETTKPDTAGVQTVSLNLPGMT